MSFLKFFEMKFTSVLAGAVAAAAALSAAPTAEAGNPAPPQPHTHRNISTYVINLDDKPEDRYLKIVPEFNETVWKFWNEDFANHTLARDALFLLVDKRGKENDEQMREIQGLANAARLPVQFVHAMQMLYELGTLMVPVANLTEYPDAFVDPIPEEWAALKDLPWRGPACTGIVAKNSVDGTVYHARNLDFSPLPIMQDLVYNAIFEKGGKEVFRSQMVAGYTMVITGARMGEDGYSIERNTRYTNHVGGNELMLDNLLNKKTTLNGWQLRKVLETTATYEEAVQSLSTVPYTSTEYTIISGVQKGTILSRDPDDVAYQQVLGQPNFNEPEDYIIMTNFDFFFDDIRETFDDTSGHTGTQCLMSRSHMHAGASAPSRSGRVLNCVLPPLVSVCFRAGHPTRREVAQEILNASIPTGLTQDVLFDTINAQGVIAYDTIFQAVINIEKGIWNVSQPNI